MRHLVPRQPTFARYCPTRRDITDVPGHPWRPVLAANRLARPQVILGVGAIMSWRSGGISRAIACRRRPWLSYWCLLDARRVRPLRTQRQVSSPAQHRPVLGPPTYLQRTCGSTEATPPRPGMTSTDEPTPWPESRSPRIRRTDSSCRLVDTSSRTAVPNSRTPSCCLQGPPFIWTFRTGVSSPTSRVVNLCWLPRDRGRSHFRRRGTQVDSWHHDVHAESDPRFRCHLRG